MRFFSRSVTVFVFLLTVTLVMIFLHIRGGTKKMESAATQAPRPIIYVLNGVGSSFKSFFTYFSSVSKVNKKNAELSADVLRLQQDNIVLQQYRLENEKLKKELAYRAVPKFSLISATVIAKDPTGYSQAVILNVGASDGVTAGAGVMAQGVLIGKIVSVEGFTSKVLLVTDPQSSIDAQVSATGDNAIARGSYGSGIIVDMVSQNVTLNKGDEIVTAGLSADLPQGILIGTVGQLQSQKNDLLQKATLVSSTDLKNIRFVSVIKK